MLALFRYGYTRWGKLRRFFASGFRLKQWEGIGIAAPPSYMETQVEDKFAEAGA